MMRMLCVATYVNDARGLRFEPGQTFEADPELARYLIADAPLCFGPAPTEKAVKAPAEDKAVKAPKAAK